MHPNLTSFVNRGSIEVIVQVTELTNFIVIHSKELNITQATLSNDINIVKILEYKPFEQLYLGFKDKLLPYVNYSLQINFTKKMEERLEGFYISSYVSGGKKHYLATTHFEPTAARSAFPCFDEPSLKATFALKMVHENIHDVLFNAEKLERIPYNSKEGLMLSVFDTTVKMSTYLVAFVVSDFKGNKDNTKEGIVVRVFVPGDQYNQAEYSLKSATQVLSYFQEFFNVTYPLSKLDLVAIPDFGAGAMENWGLLTFRTTLILFDERNSPSDIQEEIDIVISHEVAHQWFGNLVTMKWWSDLWLNEGFASFVENLGVDHLHPDWRMIDQFVWKTTQSALSLDSLDSSHPITVNVTNPNEIEAVFDSISYKKGAALIRMLQNFLGAEKLRLGLRNYLGKYSFHNAETDDLWKCFSEVTSNSHLNVAAIMETWVKQKGYPVITAKLTEAGLLLMQKRFLSSPPINIDSESEEPNESSPFNYQWIVPITLMTDQLQSHLLWMNSSSLVIPFMDRIEWYKVNINQTGFYRVNYDHYNWGKLIQLLERGPHNHLLSPVDRANIIDDAFVFMKMGDLPPSIAMNVTNYLSLRKEREYVPWATALQNLKYLDIQMNGHPLLHKFIRRILRPALSMWQEGWTDGANHLERKLKSSLLKAATYYGDSINTKIALKKFKEWLSNKYMPKPDFRLTIYMTGIRYGGLKEWNACWEKYQKERLPSEKRILLMALSFTQDPWLLSRYLNYSLDRTKIKTQDTPYVISYVSNNPVGRLIAWRFVKSNWKVLLNLFGQGSFSMDLIISETGLHFSHRYDYQELKDFYSKVEIGPGLLSVKQTLERIKGNIYFKDRVEGKLVEWLQSVDTIENEPIRFCEESR